MIIQVIIKAKMIINQQLNVKILYLLKNIFFYYWELLFESSINVCNGLKENE